MFGNRETPVPRWRRQILWLACSLLVFVAVGSHAAPHHGDRFQLAQPDGSWVEVLVWGDEFYQRVESADGYTLVRDPQSGVICYADLATDGRSFLSTGVAVGATPPSGLPRGLQLVPEARAAAGNAVRARFLAEEAAMLAAKTQTPQPSTMGAVRGLTLIIDFSDEIGSVPPSAFEAYLNEIGYTGYGNNGSVRDYFRDVSGGALDYTNYLPTAYIRAPHPKSYYEDPSVSYGLRARELVAWALNQLDSQGHNFQQYDANSDGFIDAINVFYAGFPSGGWSVGLWPHSWVVSFSADGVQSYKYQITNIGNNLALATFCHENGHMLCFWPDLYDYGFESNGVGRFCLMCSSGPGTNPVRPCAYLRASAGWVVPELLAGLQPAVEVSHATMNVYKVARPGVETEYYLFENRQRAGRDASLPDAGLAIWHVDENGSNDNEQQTPSSHYLVTLVQADGRWDLEQGVNNGDATDLWKAPTYVEFNPDTDPPARWWNLTDAALYVDEIGPSAPVMQFNFRESLGTMSVTIQPQPDDINAPWLLTGPGDFQLAGEGPRQTLVWTEGSYTLTWGAVGGWTLPDPPVETFAVSEAGEPPVVSGTYSNPPFAAVLAGPAAHTGPVAGVAIVDIDGDGRCDLHIVNDGAADLVLRNESGLVFSDMTPAELADAGAGRAGVWGDHDNNGEPDVYLVRAGQPNRLLAQTGGVFSDVTTFSYGLDDSGPGSVAAWCDFDNDGLLDLYLVQAGEPNVLFKNYGDMYGDHYILLPASHWALQDAGVGRAGRWCDYQLDGYRDVYVVNDGAANILVVNNGGTSFDNSLDSMVADPSAGRDAAWGDFDNNGEWDLYLVNSSAEDVYIRRQSGFFQTYPSPAISDVGAGRAVVAADFDNDGALDLYVARQGQADLLIFGDGAGGLRRSAMLLPQTEGASVAVACGDLDGDGGVDLYVGRYNEANIILHNQIVDRGHWLALDLRGATANRDAIGARVRLVAGGRVQLREVSGGGGAGQLDRILHYGLGSASVADSIVVTWPVGEPTILVDVAGDRRVLVNQSGGGTPVTPETAPTATALLGIHPNPFNPSTTIHFALAAAGPVRLSIHSLDGRRVADLVRADLPAGVHQAIWHGRDAEGRTVASGTYFCRLQTHSGADSRRLTIVK